MRRQFLGVWCLALLTFAGCASTPEPTPEANCSITRAQACLDTGFELATDESPGTTPNWPLILSHFETACAGDLGEGCSRAALILQGEEGVEPDKSRAAKLFEVACELGEPMACLNLGNQLMREHWKAPHDPKEPPPVQDQVQKAGFLRAAGLFSKVCRLDDGAALQAKTRWGIALRGWGCAGLATLHEHGFGVAQNHDKAFAYFTKGCNRGWPAACAQVGFFYHRGVGRPADTTKAMPFYEEACEARDTMGCSNLATIHLEATPPNTGEAKRLLRRACELRDAGACERAKTLE